MKRDAEAAHQASPAPWCHDDECVYSRNNLIVVDRSCASDDGHPEQARDLPYIALVHPGVGLTLAELLEVEAAVLDTMSQQSPDITTEQLAAMGHGPLAVARQILGTASTETPAADDNPRLVPADLGLPPAEDIALLRRTLEAAEEGRAELRAENARLRAAVYRADLPDRLQAFLTERFTSLGNPFSEMRHQEKGPDGWPASHPVGLHRVAEVLRELLSASCLGRL
ncbi:hypothetical protein ACFU98_33055 [Streptomyces sp. NPDC057575]|uniref:hypothetical protein n=1 Tax=unclassified Streptomyces TaxID=2593676 RepID=UPI00368A2202